jgi:SHS2 domain-containing protein
LGSVEYFDHTADVGLRIQAESLNNLFQTAAEALFDYIVVNRSDVRSVVVETVELKAESPADLFVDWLNELIFRCETSHHLYGRFSVVIDDDGRSMKAEISGEPIDRNRHILDHEVKAVTRHAQTLMQENSVWVAECILDI